jgi:hypothetical protein
VFALTDATAGHGGFQLAKLEGDQIVGMPPLTDHRIAWSSWREHGNSKNRTDGLVEKKPVAHSMAACRS